MKICSNTGTVTESLLTYERIVSASEIRFLTHRAYSPPEVNKRFSICLRPYNTNLMIPIPNSLNISSCNRLIP